MCISIEDSVACDPTISQIVFSRTRTRCAFFRSLVSQLLLDKHGKNTGGNFMRLEKLRAQNKDLKQRLDKLTQRREDLTVGCTEELGLPCSCKLPPNPTDWEAHLLMC